MKVTVLLRNDHEVLKALFNKFNKSSSGKNQNGKKDLFNEIRREIQVHAQMEREIFYPALSTTSSSEAAALVTKAEQQQRSVDKLIQELNSMSGSEKTFETKMASLIDAVVQHIQMEEEEIFDEARKNLPEYRLEELGLEMEDRRKILVTLAA
jgi:iron-sulfur cluster repair protein YtfE (RIC family)